MGPYEPLANPKPILIKYENTHEEDSANLNWFYYSLLILKDQ